jgi:ABC-type transport system involved in multi-copper enzyme maturation permease subunit
MMALSRILTIATNTVREAIRNRLLYTLLFFAIVLILSGIFLSTLSYVESERILQDIGLAAIRVFGVAIALFVGVGLIYKEVDRRTVYTILSKPLTRAEFLLGKYVGLVLTVWMQCAIMVTAFAGVSLLTGAPLTTTHAAAFALIGAELAVVVAIATFFSAFTTPMLASFFTGGLWVVGNLTRNLRDLGAHSDLESVQIATRWLFRLLPDLQGFNLSIEAVHGLPVSASDTWLPLLYGAGYATIVLALAVALFQRRDFR